MSYSTNENGKPDEVHNITNTCCKCGKCQGNTSPQEQEELEMKPY